MDKETKYKKTYSLKDAFFPLVIFTILIICLLFNAGSMIEIMICLAILSFIFFVWIGMIVGTLKGKMQILKEKKYIEKMNPYIYYRNLPNNFGIGVTSLLLDSTIENDIDIVAVILDLCAKKYLRLIKQNDKYVIQVLKEMDHHLLSNEKYILTLIRNNDIKNINYQEWYNYCMQDGIDLGLYYHKEIDIHNHESHDDDIVKKTEIIHLKISIAIAMLIFVVSLFKVNVLESLANGITVFMLSYIALFIPFYFIHAFTALKSIGDSVKDENYKMTIENHLKKTEKGVEELHKLYSFKAFIRDFGNFVDKKAEEVVIWDRYLSYAQVFGLTEEIMKSGYQELVDNASFQIDHIENIHLDNIEIESSSKVKA